MDWKTFAYSIGMITGGLSGNVLASQAPEILSDRDLLTGERWAAFHQNDDGSHQQMTIRARAGALYTIESSEDLLTWTAEATHYGYFHGQLIEQLLFEHSDPGVPPGGGSGAGFNLQPRTSVFLTLRNVPSGGILVSWQSLDSGEMVRYHLADRSLHSNWSMLPISSASDDDDSISAMHTGSYTGETIPAPRLGADDVLRFRAGT